jgi:hypothetical protein
MLAMAAPVSRFSGGALLQADEKENGVLHLQIAFPFSLHSTRLTKSVTLKHAPANVFKGTS